MLFTRPIYRFKSLGIEDFKVFLKEDNIYETINYYAVYRTALATLRGEGQPSPRLYYGAFVLV